MKTNAGAVTPKQKQIRFKIVALTLNIIYKCVQQGNNNFLQDKERVTNWVLLYLAKHASCLILQVSIFLYLANSISC
jgi:hypothetical protein